MEACIYTLSGDFVGDSFTINYTTIDGQAKGITIFPKQVYDIHVCVLLLATLDYETSSGSFAISESNTSQCLSVSIVSDSVVETDQECFIVTFSSSASDFILQAPSIATICISDGRVFGIVYIIILKPIHFLSAPVVVPVTIGLQYTQYTISDTADYEFVCAEVQSGSVACREILINYVVEDDGNETIVDTLILITSALFPFFISAIL